MDYMKLLHEDNGLSELLCDVFDIEILPEFKTPQDECGHLAYNIPGKHLPEQVPGVNIFYLKMVP